MYCFISYSSSHCISKIEKTQSAEVGTLIFAVKTTSFRADKLLLYIADRASNMRYII